VDECEPLPTRRPGPPGWKEASYTGPRLARAAAPPAAGTYHNSSMSMNGVEARE